MKIVVLGSGVIGVTSAYYLAQDGHEVTVLDRQPGPALETSFANAGEICPGCATPWAAPGLPLKALKWLFAEHAPLILRPRLDPAMASWLLAMLRNCSAECYAANRRRMTRLAVYSQDELGALRAATGIAYDERRQGSLQLFRTARQVDEADRDVAVLRASGLAFELLDATGCVAAEPALDKVRDRIAGGLRMPGDETGDCFKFTVALAELAARYGASFRHGVTVRRLLTEGDRVTGVETDVGIVAADAYVAALGSFTPALLAPLGLAVPIYPVKGYSITVPITDAASAPVSTVVDETYKVAITRLGARMRVGGMAEISGFGMGLPAARRATLEKFAGELFPDAGDLASATFWTGLRPMTPDGAPAIGRTRLANLFVNAGHGTLGWTMACGSGRILADLVSGRRPQIEVDDLAPARFAARA